MATTTALSLSCHRPLAESAVAAAWRAGLSWRLGNYPPTVARPQPCRIGSCALHGLRTRPPSLGTVARDADTLLPWSPRSRCLFVTRGPSTSLTSCRWQTFTPASTLPMSSDKQGPMGLTQPAKATVIFWTADLRVTASTRIVLVMTRPSPGAL